MRRVSWGGGMRRVRLGARNRSILAHGFRPLAAHDAHRLLTGLLGLAERKGEELPLFPKLGRMLL